MYGKNGDARKRIFHDRIGVEWKIYGLGFLFGITHQAWCCLTVNSVIFSIHTKQSWKILILGCHFQREEAVAAREKFMSSEGDHISLLNIYKAYRSVNGNKVTIWATSWQNQQNGMCAQRRLRLRSGHRQSSLSAWRKLGRCPGWSEFAGRTCHFVGFVTRRLI